MILYFPVLKEENNVDDKIIKLEAGSKICKTEIWKTGLWYNSWPIFHYIGVFMDQAYKKSTTFQPISHRGCLSSSLMVKTKELKAVCRLDGCAKGHGH